MQRTIHFQMNLKALSCANLNKSKIHFLHIHLIPKSFVHAKNIVTAELIYNIHGCGTLHHLMNLKKPNDEMVVIAMQLHVNNKFPILNPCFLYNLKNPP